MLLGFAAHAGAAEPSIRFAEPVSLFLKGGNTQFDAYGRRFSLAMMANERVLQKLSSTQRSALGAYRLLRGSLDGVPGSWVRLTETAKGVEGAIWDGEEFYAVTRYESIASQLTTPLDAAPGQTVVYRLSDLRDALPRDFCALESVTAEADARTGLDQYNALVADLGGGVIGPSITRQMEISLIADTAFQLAEPGDPMAAMLARLNIVEGIFSEQVGLLIQASDIRMMSADSDPFTSTKGTTLLEQLGSYRSATAAVRARGVAHLMTGKDLDGTTAGIAYVKTVCEKERGVSLSMRSYGTTLSALIMAHELGHNFGAHHDSEPGTVCANTPSGFIMSSSVTGYGTFSQCSIDTMKPVLASASCVSPAQYADALLETGLTSVTGEAGVPFTLPFTVRSAGNIDAQDVEFTVTVPGSISYSLSSAVSSQGACSINGYTATCALGTMAVGGEAQVSVTGMASATSNFTAQARVTASNDRLTSNNNRQLPVSLRSGIDARLTLTASASEVPVGAPLELYADVTSMRALPLRNATLSVSLNQPVSSASMTGGSCTVAASSVVCSLADLPSGESRRLVVQALAQNAGALFAIGSVGVAGDGDLGNNNASAAGWVQAARDVELTSTTSSLEVAVGAIQEITYTVRSRGPQSTGDVELLLTVPGVLQVEALDAGGATCVHPSDYVWRCALGAFAPGGAQSVRLRVLGSAPSTGEIAAVAVTTDDGYATNNTVNLQLRVDHLVDLGISIASGGSGLEGEPLEGQVGLRSGGKYTATGGSLDITLHAAGVLQYAAINHGAACELLSATRARCALPNMARNASLYVDYVAQFAEPGDYDITFAARAAGDTAPENDVLTRPVLVRPYLDASVNGSLSMTGLFGGQTRVQTFTLRSDRRALESARFLAAHAMPALRVDAISADGADCRVDAELGGLCDFQNLAANASVPVSVTYRAQEGWWVVDPVISVSTPGDVVGDNNTLTASVETLGTTDLELRVGESLNGSRSSSLSFPLIELVNGSNKAMTPRLEITLPPQLTVMDVSAGDAICTGTTTVRCDFDTLEPFARASVGLNVRATANGSFTSNVKVTAANDTNPANDAKTVAVEITGASVAANNSGSSGKGGGGRVEWLLLLFLALMKWGHSPFAGKRGQASLGR